jgi:ABC-type multidrug transport system fused ATPase/permease subunit
MNWFIKNPTSRITIRVTRDQRVIDEELSNVLALTFDALIMVVGGLCILNVIYFGAMAIATFLLFLIVLTVLKKFFKVTHVLTQQQAIKSAILQGVYFRANNEALHFRSICMLTALRERFFKATDEF